jgi:hypothetical protein
VSAVGDPKPDRRKNVSRRFDGDAVASDRTTRDYDHAASLTASVPLDRFRLAHLCDLGELESGVYWPRLQPYFLKPYFRRLTYRLTAALPGDRTRGEILSTRGACGVGELDIAYIADRCPAELVITETGLPDYCRRWSVAGLGPGRPLLVP